MATAIASGSAPPVDGEVRQRGRPRGSGRGRERERSESVRRSKRPRKPRPWRSTSPGPHSSPPALEPPAPLPPGTEVEVRIDDDGFHGTWFEATVLDFAPARGYRNPARYTVKYAHLLADDEGALAEPFAPSQIRPRPPPLSSPPRFQLHDIVEAFHNEGWWSGIVVSTPDAAAAGVTVSFPITREVIEFPSSLVRPRRDYVDGDWIPSRVAMVLRPNRAVKVYEVGEKVEVVRNRDVYGNSWFPATVRVVVDDLSYVVEYFDLEEEGKDGPEKATEYLHWWFIRPAVEHSPSKREFQLRPGAAVEAYCDGAWSLGVVTRVVGEGEYEISIVGKKTRLLVTKVVELLKPQYIWNGNQWRITTAKGQTKLRRRSKSGESPSAPVDLISSGEEQSHDPDSSSTKKSRKELKQLDPTLAEDSEHVSVSEMDIPLLGHSAPVNNQETLAGMGVFDGELHGSVSGRSVDAHDMLCIAELRKKMASARRNSAVRHTEEQLVKSLGVKKCISNSKEGKTRPIQELQGKLKGNNNFSRNIVLALSVSRDGQTNLSPDRLVSIGTKRGSSTKVLACKKLAKRRRSNPNSSLDVTRTVQQRGRKEVAEPMKDHPLALECSKSDAQGQLDRTLEDAQNITELSNQENLLPMVPPGLISMSNGKGTNIHDTQFEEEPTGMNNSLIEPNGNDDICTDHAATKLAKSNHVMETTTLSVDCPAQQPCGKVDERSVLRHIQNDGSSQCIIDIPPLRSCSAFGSSLPSLQASFVKRSPVWGVVEAKHVFKELPQQPHFLTLQEFPPTLREGIALGMMVSFSELVKFTMEASIDNSMEWFEDKIRTVSHLEANGFSVQSIQSVLTELIKIKSERTRYHGEIGKLSSKLAENTASSFRVGALLDEKDGAAAQLEQELGRIRQESQKMAQEKEKIDAEGVNIKAACSGFEDLCSDAERKFKEVLAGLQRKSTG